MIKVNMVCFSSVRFGLRLGYPDNRGFSLHAKYGEKRKTSEEIVSKSR